MKQKSSLNFPSKVTTVFLSLALAISFVPLSAHAAGTAVMYRLYNPNSGEHFYTASAVERDAVIAAGWNDEGEGWTAPTEGVQVYRLYNSYAGEHHYTTSEAERDMLVEAGWTWEEGGWYSDENEAVPLYRAYNPNAYANNHHYTTDSGEFQLLLSIGWQDEGIGWYGVDPNAWDDEDWGSSGEDPANPSNPGSSTPSTPDTPSTDPGTPSKPGTPSTNPATPSDPNTPSTNPGTPNDPSTPSTPGSTTTPTEKDKVNPDKEVVLTPTTPTVSTAKYTVNHWQQKLNAGSAQNATNYTRADSESLSAEVGSSVTPEVQGYAGFTAPAAKTITVKSDGSTKVDYYYTRNSYQLTVTKDEGVTKTTGGGTVQYGATASVSATTSTSNDFAGWKGSMSSPNPTYSFTMPAGNVSLEATSEPKQNVVTSDGLTTTSIATGYYKVRSGLSSSDRKYLDMKDSSLVSGGNVQLLAANNKSEQIWYIEKVSNGYYRIANANSMLVMDMDASSKNVQQWSHGTTNSNQLWKPYKSSLGDGLIVFENKGTRLMLSVDSNTNGANVKGATKSNVLGQTWVLTPTNFTPANVTVDDGYYRLRTQAGSANKYLNVKSNTIANGGNVQLYKNDNTAACVWHLRKVSGNYYRITGAYSALCLDVVSGSSSNGANVQQYVCNDTDAQLWRLERSMYNGYVLVNKKTGKTLDVDSGACKDGQNVHSWEKNNSSAQSWKLEPVSGYSVMNRAEYTISSNTYTIKSQAGAAYVDIPGSSTANGAVAQVWSRIDSSNAQVFRIKPTGGGNGAYWIENVNSGKRLEVPSASKTEGASIAQYANNDTLAQKWYAKRSIYGTCVFVNANSGMVFDLTGGVTTNGTKLHQWTNNDSKAQSWVIKQQAKYKSEDDTAREIFDAYNNYRASRGLSRVPWDQSLVTDAKYATQNNARMGTANLIHDTAWGPKRVINGVTMLGSYSAWKNADDNGRYALADILQFTGWHATGQEVVDGWIHSTGHRKMMTCEKVAGAAVSAYCYKGVWYYALVYKWEGTTNQGKG